MDNKLEIIDKASATDLSPLIKAATALLSVSFDPAILIDEQGKILEMNEAFIDLSGGKTRKIKHTSLSQFFTDERVIRTNFRAMLEAEEPGVPFLSNLKRKGGTALEVLLKLSVCRDDNGNHLAVIVMRDVSGDKRKEEQTSQLAAIVTSSKDAIISCTPEGVIKVWNQSAYDIFGYTETEAIGQHISLIIPNELLEEENELLERIRNGGNFTPYNSLRKRKDGRIINVSIVLSPIKDSGSNIRGVSLIARETTDQKKFEKELIEARRNAEREKQLAEDAMRAKQQFLTNMSHEIRTPLNAIIGFTRVLLKTSVQDSQREYLNAIRISGDALIALINDILDLGKAEAGKMTFEQIPFKPLDAVTSMVRIFEAKLFKRKVQLLREYDSRIPEAVLGDPTRLHQIILNLVGNAVKFTSEGQIVVKTQLAEERQNEVLISFIVQDTGIGIPETELEHIFENFSQASGSTSRLYGGTGLGLAIVKQLVFNQGGTITVKSKPGEGSTFTVTLPFKKTETRSDISAEESRISEESNDVIRILVAEDVTLNQLLMKTVLTSFGFEFDIASNGRKAVEQLQKKRYDVVLMDLHMPEMNGYQATEHIRKVLRSKVPIIALTADVSSADVERSRSVGMNDYLSKPIDEKLLFSKILKFVDKPLKQGANEQEQQQPAREKVINPEVLKQQSRGNSQMARQLALTFMSETPMLINTIKQSINNMDWEALGNAAHALIPTLSVVGMRDEYEDMAKKIKEHASKKEEALLINGYVARLETACAQALKELEAELNIL